jgi:imidazoleglycerol phosphate dehydratase HisB
MVRLIATKTDLTTTGFAKLFLKEVFPNYGFPLHIVSHRGTQWNSEFFRALCTGAGVQLRFYTAYHPQTNGQVERTNETVSAALRSYVAPNMRDWPDSLSLLEFASLATMIPSRQHHSE